MLIKNCTTSIKHIRVYGIMPESGFEFIKEIMKSVAVLEMNECFIRDEFYENRSKYCPNVKTISVTRSDRIDKPLINLNALSVWCCDDENLLGYLSNLEKIYFLHTTFDRLLQLVRFWPKLKQIRVEKVFQEKFIQVLILKLLI